MPSPRPNIILILADDQRFDTIAALGAREIDTPNLDRLVRSGTAFTCAHHMGSTHVAVCMPSRAMLLTGRSLFSLEHHGQVIPTAQTTFPELFRGCGYVTCQIGKWHQDRASHGRMFDTARKIFGFADRGWYEGCNGHWHTPVFDHDPSGAYPAGAMYHDPPLEPFRPPYERTKPNGRHSAEVFTDAAIDFIRERRNASDGRPFLLWLAHLAPHDPRQYPARLAERYHRDAVSLPPNFATKHPFDNGEMTVRDELLEGQPRRPEDVRQAMADYFAIIAHLDVQVGRILDELELTSAAENTIVAFTSDHGLACGQHGLMGKQNLYDHSLRIPLLLAGPGIPAGERRRTPCYLMDLNPTLCGLAGVPCAPGSDGRSLVPALDDPSRTIRDTLHFAYRGFQRAVRRDDMKLIEYVVGGRRATQLFDTAADPFERCNLAGDPGRAKTLATLRRELRRWPDVLGDTAAAGESFWGGFESHHQLGPWKPGMHVHE